MLPFSLTPGNSASPPLRAWLLLGPMGIPGLAALLLLRCLMLMPSLELYQGHLQGFHDLALHCPRSPPSHGLVSCTYHQWFQPYSKRWRCRQLPVSGRRMHCPLLLAALQAGSMLIGPTGSALIVVDSPLRMSYTWCLNGDIHGLSQDATGLVRSLNLKYYACIVRLLGASAQCKAVQCIT